MYKELQKSFYEPLVHKFESIVKIIKGQPNDIKRLQYLYNFICCPIFNSSLSEEDALGYALREKILKSSTIMDNMPSNIKSLIFVILASETKSQAKTDKLLLLLKPNIDGLHNLDTVSDIKYSSNVQNKLNYKAFGQGDNRATKVVYLARCKRFNVLKAYMEGQEDGIT